MMDKNKVAVIGANGQIGSVAVRHLVGAGYHVVAVCRNEVGAGLVKGIGCEIRIGSVTDDQAAKTLLGDCTVVINCVWPPGLPQAVKSQNFSIVRNIARLKNLTKYIHLSSVAVYGSCADNSRSSFEKPRPDLDYGKSKLQLEKYIANIFSKTSTDYYLLRLGHVYGPNQWLSRMILDAAQKPETRLAFDGERKSNAIHVDQVVSAFMRIMSQSLEKGVYNLAGSPHQSWRRIFDWHCDTCGLAHVKGLPFEASQALRNKAIQEQRKCIFVKSMARTFRWFRLLSFGQLLFSDEIRDLIMPLFGVLPKKMQGRLKAVKAIRMTRKEIEKLTCPAKSSNALLCSDPMPGRYLEVPPSFSVQTDPQAQLKQWFMAAYGIDLFSSNLVQPERSLS